MKGDIREDTLVIEPLTTKRISKSRIVDAEFHSRPVVHVKRSIYITADEFQPVLLITANKCSFPRSIFFDKTW